jgi:proteasome lid subunit RPN8/RPN11
VELAGETQQALLRALESAGGHEVVGFLVGEGDAENAEFWRVRNYGEQPGLFALDPAEVERVKRAATRRGQRLVAFVHSHLSGLGGSDADRLGQPMTALPWMIVRLERGQLCYRMHVAG